MKVFATNYLESMAENSDGDNGTGRPTKTITYVDRVAFTKDEDMPQEGMADGMLIA